MAEKLKTFSGTRVQAEAAFNKFLSDNDILYSDVMMTGTDEHLIIGVMYKKSQPNKMYSVY